MLARGLLLCPGMLIWSKLCSVHHEPSLPPLVMATIWAPAILAFSAAERVSSVPPENEQAMKRVLALQPP